MKFLFFILLLLSFGARAQEESLGDAPATSSDQQLGIPEEEPLPLDEPMPDTMSPSTNKPTDKPAERSTDRPANRAAIEMPEEPTEEKTEEKPAAEKAPAKRRKRKSAKSSERASEGGTESASGAAAGSTTASAAKSKTTKLWQIGPRFMLWQEKIKGSESGSPLIYNARFTAFAAAYSYKHSWGNSKRWLYAHEADLIIGNVKASGTVNSTTDNLNSLIFFGFQLSPGIAYRTANATLITLSAPIFYRKLSWDLGRTTLNLGDESAFDVGLGVNGSWRLGSGTFITTGVTARIHSALWTVGVDFRL